MTSTKKAPPLIRHTFDSVDPRLTRVFLPWAINHPRYLTSFGRLILAHKITEKARAKELDGGLRVPPFLILSITKRCNLNCSGCFAAATGTVKHECEGKGQDNKKSKTTLNLDEWRKIIKDASDLGVFGFVIAGGEPFLFPGLLDLCEEFNDRFFLILTNGTTISKQDYERFKKISNIAIIISVEGGEELTNLRRGKGVYEKAIENLKKLDSIGTLTGISVTINRINFKYWMEEKHIDQLIREGIKIAAFIEYIPLTPANKTVTVPKNQLENSKSPNLWESKNDHDLMLNPKEREDFRSQILNFRATKAIYLIHSPGDEEYFGGCVSAGRGFAHVTPEGDLTPCPVSNIATHNLATENLRDALLSPLFKKICENEHLLETDEMPCALFAHPKEVDELAKSVGAYRTGIR